MPDSAKRLTRKTVFATSSLSMLTTWAYRWRYAGCGQWAPTSSYVIRMMSWLAAPLGTRRRVPPSWRSRCRSVELVGVAHRARGVGSEADVTVAVLAVERRRPGAAGELVLADALPAFRYRSSLPRHFTSSSITCE